MSSLSESKTYNSGLINISKLAYKYNKHTKTFHKDKIQIIFILHSITCKCIVFWYFLLEL